MQKKTTISIFAVSLMREIETSFGFISNMNVVLQSSLEIFMDESTLNAMMRTI